MTIEYLDLADYVAIAAEVTGLDLQTVLNMTNADFDAKNTKYNF